MLATDPLWGPATQYLQSYMELVRNNSDGWPYWSSGTKPAGTLGKMVYDAMGARRGFTHGYVKPSQAEVRKAMMRIQRFVNSNKHFKAAGVKPPTMPF